jgi:hypothetical protein
VGAAANKFEVEQVASNCGRSQFILSNVSWPWLFARCRRHVLGAHTVEFAQCSQGTVEGMSLLFELSYDPV